MPKLKDLKIWPTFIRPASRSWIDSAGIYWRTEGNPVRLWDPISGELLLVGQVSPEIFSPPGAERTLAAGSVVGHEFGNRVFDLDTGAEIAFLPIQHDLKADRSRGCYHVGGISPDSETMAVSLVADPSSISLLEIPSGAELAKLAGHTGPVRSIAFSADGKRLLSFAQEVRLWDLSTKQTICQLERNGDDLIRSVVLSPEGRHFGVRYDKWVELRDVQTRQVVSRLETAAQGRFVRDICFDRQSVLLALEQDYSQERLVARVHDVAAGRQLCEVPAPGDPGKATRFLLSPRGDLLAAEVDDVVHVWDLLTGELRKKLPLGEWHEEWTVRFTPDGRLLTSN